MPKVYTIHPEESGIVRARGFKPPLQTIILSNVRALRNKIDELHAATQHRFEYMDSCIMNFSETWLNDTVNYDSIYLPEFGTPIRLDRDQQTTRKSFGGSRHGGLESHDLTRVRT